MRKCWVLSGILSALMTAGCVAQINAKPVSAKPASAKPPGTKPVQRSIIWNPSMAAALQEAKRTGKPVLAYFYAARCAPCRMLDEKTLSSAKVIKETRRWIMVKIDAERDLNLAVQSKVTHFPTVAFLNSSGSVVAGFHGFRKTGEIVQIMQSAHRKAG